MSLSHPPARALVLGGVSGLRTFGALAPLAAGGRLAGQVGRYVFPALLVGELAGDKYPAIPARSDPPALAGRVAAGAVAGNAVAGTVGAGIGATGAAASTYVAERTRAALVRRTGVPDPVFGAAEDVLAVTIAAVAARDRTAVREGEQPSKERSPVAAGARGLVASLIGTAAMTTVQTAYYKATGASPSDAPGQVGQRIIGRVSGRRVSRQHRPALNQGMHFLYGTSWGLPFGIVVGTRQQRSAPVAGLVLGTVVWAVGLAQLPALGLAPWPWKQSPRSLATDFGFHVVYGAGTGAAFHALR